MATATNTPAATAPSPLTLLPELAPTPLASWPELVGCPEWHSLRLFGRRRHPGGFEMGSERGAAGRVSTSPRPPCPSSHAGASGRSS